MINHRSRPRRLKPAASIRMTTPRNALRKLSLLGSLGFTLVACTLAGLAIGFFLDQWLDTAPGFTIGFLIFGISAGFFNMIQRGLKHKAEP